MTKQLFLKSLLLLVIGIQAHAQKIHAHNDYVHQYPFWESYTAGAASIEVDVILKDGVLCVAHDEKDILPENTLQRLYLDPLQKVVKAEGFKTLQLLIDVKKEAEASLAVLVKSIEEDYPALKVNSQVKLVISGSRPPAEAYSNYPDYIYFDHQEIDNWPADISKIALLSQPFYAYSFWKGDGELDAKALMNITSATEIAHNKGLPIRFWATPDTPLAWKTISGLGVDFINTDHPYECVNFFWKF